MSNKAQSPLKRLLAFAGKYKALTFTGLFLSGLAQLCGIVLYLCIWLVVRDLVLVAPNFTQAKNIAFYGWIAFAFASLGIIIYFAALMCTHLAAFRTASNIRKQGIAHLMKTSLGFFDSNGSGLLRNRLDEMAKAGTEYVRSIPVVKVFQQTVYSFKAFKEAIEKYSKTAELTA